MLVRASIGTLVVLGLASARLSERPTTAYLLQYSSTGCIGGCIFCPQSIVNQSARRDLVSRIPWPPVELGSVIEKLRERPGVFVRVCIQSVLKKGFIREILGVAGAIVDGVPGVPVSVAVTPVPKQFIEELESLGVERIGVGLDAATPRVFALAGKPYTWSVYMRFIDNALSVFGEHRVEAHLIRGLGESEWEFAEAMSALMSRGVDVALFALTPVRGTKAEGLGRPSITSYRRVQLIRYLLAGGMRLSEIAYPRRGLACIRDDIARDILEGFDRYTRAFLTSGCPGCNRPFYNERVRGPLYNIPSERLLGEYMDRLYAEVERAIMECRRLA